MLPPLNKLVSIAFSATIFIVKARAAEKTLYAFVVGNDGAGPEGALIQDSAEKQSFASETRSKRGAARAAMAS